MTGDSAQTVPDRVRAACARVATQASTVRIEEDLTSTYAAGLVGSGGSAGGPGDDLGEADAETRAAFAICLNAINFGSGWWPTIRKRPGDSGFLTVAAGLGDRFRERGAWSATELTRLSAGDLATVLGQETGLPLMAQFAASLVDVGEHLRDEHGNSFAAAVDSADGSAPVLVGVFAGWRSFADVSAYRGWEVPFFKRAQLAVADLGRAGVADLADLSRLTAFADNLVPHVLRVDGVLRLDSTLEAKIEAGELLEHGSAEEVELRACAVHAVDLLAAARPDLTPADVDAALWNRGREPRYKAIPRPRSRNTAY